MQTIHKFLSHATIHVAMWFERWSFWHAEKVKLPNPVYVMSLDDKMFYGVDGLSNPYKENNNRTIN